MSEPSGSANGDNSLSFLRATTLRLSEYGSLIEKVSESLMPTCPGQTAPVQLQATGTLHWGVYAALTSLLPFYLVYVFGSTLKDKKQGGSTT